MGTASDIQVSVVIPTYNSEATLERCLASVRSNRGKYRYEIIICDSGSRDHTLAIAYKYADRVLCGVPGRINRNVGVENARGDIICFTDSDCVVPNDWIDKLVDGLLRLSKNDEAVVGVGGPNVPLVDNNPSFMELAISKAVRSPLVSWRARNVCVYADERQVAHNPPVNSAMFKWAIQEVGGFNEMPGYPEDLDLDIKVTRKGYKLYYIPEPVVQHKHKGTLWEFRKQMYDFGRKRVKINRRYPGTNRFYHYGPLILCLMLYSPLFVIPVIMALTNGMYVALRERSLRLLREVFVLTIHFYSSYGMGELHEVFFDRWEGENR